MASGPVIRIGSRPSVASVVPFDPGLSRDRAVRAAASAAWSSRHALRFGLDVLRHGVCSTCELGTHGWRDDAIAGPHLCTRRLDELQTWTRDAFEPLGLPRIDELQRMDAGQLRALGRVPVPLIRRSGEARLVPMTWDDAINLVGTRMSAEGSRWAMLANPADTSNEGLFCLKRLARATDTPHIDLMGDAGHRVACSVLQWTTGSEAATCSLNTIPSADLVLLWGVGLHHHPFLSRLLHVAHARGTRVVAIGPVREPQFEGVRMSGSVDTAVFGARVVDDHVAVQGGGDRHLTWGLLKALSEIDGLDERYLVSRVAGWKRIRPHLRGLRWDDVELGCGLTRAQVRRLAGTLAAAPRGVVLCGASLGRGSWGSKTISDVLMLALARGWVGRDGSGFIPLSGMPGLRGARDVGLGPDLGPRGGWRTLEIVDAAKRGDIDLLYVVGPGLDEYLPSSPRALEELAVRVHQVHFLDPTTLLQTGEATVLLPAQSRFELRGGGTFTSVDRRVRFSPEIRGHDVGEARPDWQIPCQIACRFDPRLKQTMDPVDGAAVREQLAGLVPRYDGIQRLHAAGDSFQWGGATLHEGDFDTSDGRARIPPVDPPTTPRPGLRLTVRRTGIDRKAIHVCEAVALRLGVEDGTRVRLANEWGELGGVIRIAPVADHTVHAYWPEGAVLFPHGPDAGQTAGSPLTVTLEAL